ncbi:MAG TPA: O-antigen ligase family protein [Puia sp.]
MQNITNFSTKEKILYWLSAGFFITLLLPDMPVINNAFTGALFLFSWLYNKPADKWRTLLHRKEIVLMLFFFALHIMSAFLSHDKEEGFKLLVLRLPLLVFPLSLGLLYIRTALKDRIILAYGGAISLGALACVVWAWVRYSQTRDVVWLYNDSLTELLKIQSSYYALMVLMAVTGFVYLLWKGYFSRRLATYVYVLLVLLLIFHFMLASRISIFLLYTGLLIFAGTYVVQHRKMGLAVWLIIALVVGLGLCVKLLPKTMNRFRELEYPSYSYSSEAPEAHYNGTLEPDQWNGANIRLAIWKCGWEVTRKHWLTGVQLGDKQDSLMAAYKEKGFQFAYDRKRNMHNNYLDIAS